MEAEITNSENSSELPLAQPHFDDEATVLSARRVVPLDEVPSQAPQAKSRFARGWMFATIVLGSLLLGVVAGAAYYSYLNRAPAPSVADRDNIAAGVDGTSTEPAPNNEVRALEANNTTPADSNAEVSDKERPAPAPPAVSSNESKKPLTHEELKAARREARERKRELERQSRRTRDDVTRIREIFEGPQRP